jgi:hypothetical protein
VLHQLLRRWRVRMILPMVGAVLLSGTVTAGAVAATTRASFKMVVSGGAATCLPHASANVTIRSLGPVEVMDVDVEGLPPKTDFDFFVIQAPTAPFGVSWYQGDIETNGNGKGHETFIGRFSVETFAVSPGPVVPPQVHTDGMFPDATEGVSFRPIHTYHLGLWFNSPVDAGNAGCPTAETPFNGEHTAGIQVLNTNNFPLEDGPLRQITP